MTIPNVAVVIVAYRSRDFLPACLDGLAGQSYRDFEVVIVVNGQDDDSVDGLVLPDERFRIVRLPTNVGFAAANNYAATRVRAQWFAALNPDAVPERTWLANLLEASQRWPNAAAFGSTQLLLDNPGILDGAGDVWHVAGLCWRSRLGSPADDLPAEGEVFGPCAAAALYRRDAFLAVGGFDEGYFCYCEDVDLAFRLRLVGYICVQVPLAVVLHAGSGVSGKNSEFSLYHAHRNRIWTYFKDTPGAWLFVMLPFHLAVNLLLLMKAALEGAGGPVARAYVSAIRGLPRIWRERKNVQAMRKASASTVLAAMDWGLSTNDPVGVRGGPAVPSVQDKAGTPGRVHSPALSLARRRR